MSLLLVFTLINSVLAQTQTVTGKVTAASDGSALPGVTVLEKGSTNGTTTGLNGEYQLTVSPNSVLVFRFIGMSTLEIPVNNRSTVNAQLETDQKVLDEVVVVGYGTQSKQTITGSTASLSSKDIAETPVTSVEQAIQGKAAGVFIQSNNGKLGQGIQVRVRGTSSLSASSQPLYVVDGIPITSENLSGTSAGTNPLADINFNDVESIEVLKDASAAAIYGARASNGVVIITTKKGKSGASRVNFTAQWGTSEPSRHRDFMNAEQYVQTMQRAGQGAAVQDFAAGYFETLEEAQDYYTSYVNGRLTRYSAGNEDWLTGAVNTNWEREAFQSASQAQYDLNFSGGNDKTTYYISGQYLDQTGIIVGNAFKRYSGRINLDNKVNNILNIGMNLSFANTQNDRVANDNAFSTPIQIVALSPITPIIDPRTGLLSGSLPGEASTYPVYYNPLLSVDNASYQTNVYRTIGNIYGQLKLSESLSFRSEFGLDQLNQNENSYYGQLTFRNTGTQNGFSEDGYTQVLNYNTNNYFSYKNIFNDDHSLDVTAGMSYQYSKTNSNLVQGQQFPSDAYRQISSAALISEGSSRETQYSFLSYFGRANYIFKNKYLLTASARVDGSSRFGSENRYGFFPAGSVGWIISEEDFFQDINVLTNLKVRASYGLTGNADILTDGQINNFASLGLFSGDAGYNGVAGQRITQIANPDLKWESTAQLDFGVDFGFLNDRLTGSFDYYRKNTRDLLLNVNVPATSGFATQLQNLGKLYNQGYELTLNSENFIGEFRWSTSFNAAYNKNRVTDIQGQVLGTNDLNRVIEGQPIGVFFGKEYAGVDPANGDALYYLNTENSDGTINRATTSDYNEAENVILGNPTPTFTGGLTNNFAYKGFDLSFTFQAVAGNKIYNGGGQYMSANGSNGFDNQTADQINYWNQPGDITDVPEPRLWYGNGTAASSRYLSDGDYVRLKTFSFGYNLPKNLISKFKMQKARLFMNAYNLFMVTGYKGWDPEVNADYQASNINLGVDFYSAPQPRTITFGVNVGF
ncbi:SusC/RagA family TonB-linked outer membrane protein [Pontibacter silvestris]|uniref:SusC/RagA family TonB-linked outer membrane protein n=2 Tax=Pontibacter silvestris TaxID=2305183 RepID=A0ABW4X1Q0_9BACT|nr:TonB-dependent receptor [Pontibacter silvestris]MCC9135520.1 TonB-dependent receptor [Pontibacter silvestris]